MQRGSSSEGCELSSRTILHISVQIVLTVGKRKLLSTHARSANYRVQVFDGVR
jgi:hypothetical protein